jgi:hypothetical protein
MLGRIVSTGSVLLLGLGGFFGLGPAPGGPLNPIGIVALGLSGVIWFGWEMIGDAYAYREEVCPSRGQGFLQTVRLGPVLVGGLIRREPTRVRVKGGSG